MWRDFKAFLVKQNALALAIGVVVGSALDTVVKAIVNGLLMPIIAPLQAATAGDYSKLTWAVGPFRFAPGIVLASLVNFVIIGFVLFLIIQAYEKAATRMGFLKDDAGPTDNELLAEIRDLLKQRQA